MNCVMPYTNFAVAGGMENNPGILHIHVGSSAQWHPQWYHCAATDPVQRWVGSLGQSGAVCTCACTGPHIDSHFPATNKHCIRNYLISAEPRSGRLISNPIVNHKVLNLLNSAILMSDIVCLLIAGTGNYQQCRNSTELGCLSFLRFSLSVLYG